MEEKIPSFEKFYENLKNINVEKDNVNNDEPDTSKLSEENENITEIDILREERIRRFNELPIEIQECMKKPGYVVKNPIRKIYKH